MVGVVAQAQSILGLVNDATARGAMCIVVLGAAQLVHSRLRVRLGRVGLHVAGDLIGGAGNRLLDLGARRLGRLGLLFGAWSQ